MKKTTPYLFVLFLSTLWMFSCAQMQSDDYKILRRKMIEDQVIARGITDTVIINTMMKVERHKFVPRNIQHFAYGDYPMPIGEGQTISQPYIVALMTDLLEIKNTDKILEVGTGSGYQAAILAELCDKVFTIEINKKLATSAEKRLKKLGYDNIDVRCGDGYQGWKEHAPFDAIIVTCSPTHVPEPLQEQLKEGGKLVIPVGDKLDQHLLLFEKVNGELKKQHDDIVRFVPMINEEGKTY